MSFILPTKRITDPGHVETFKTSEAYRKLTAFITTIGDVVKSRSMSESCPESDGIKRMLAALDKLDELVEQTPPSDAKGRFGNPAYREWFGKMTEQSEALMVDVLGDNQPPAIVEVALYFRESFGNKTRIDYGSGHELAFIACLCCLSLVGVFGPEDSMALCNRVFNRYLQLVRKIQTTYKLEPAGSHGVWGLDDFQFLCYYWGAAQLAGQDFVKPSDIPNESAARANSSDYMFFGAVHYIFQVKTGPFFEHSRYLFDMSGVASWNKIYKGLLNMYKDEVLHKFPVIQHFFFGSLLPIDLDPKPTTTPPTTTFRQLPKGFESNPQGVPSWGGPLPDRDADAPAAIDPSQMTPGSGVQPMTAFPQPGVGVGLGGPPVEMRTGTSRVAERGSLARRTPK
eukprot:TRINITY_DN12279_c0_g3_i1.p1 TRINITY_DN12279_c0_g3~~TRINITY_DN12279_c0_g3_i1.p1  ORF type:complete len:397 (+),score=72.37 TRINITY_DN12279_c0_g3_i1:112-1302(+)